MAAVKSATDHTGGVNLFRAAVVILLPAAILYSVFIRQAAFRAEGRTFYALSDDPMISMTYARNLAEGHGLVWNAGEAPVEGYTNFLWTLWMSLFHLLPVAESRTSLWIMVSGAAILLGNVLAVIGLTREIYGSRSHALAAGALVAFYFPLIFWTLQGFEVGLLSLLLSGAVLAAIRRAGSGSGSLAIFQAVLLSLGLLTRPDAVVPVAFIMGYSIVSTRKGNPWGTAAVVAVPLLALAAHVAFRLIYYHALFPNTYYLKLAGIPLADRLSRGAVTFRNITLLHLWPLLSLVVYRFLGSGKSGTGGKGAGREEFLLLAVAASLCAYSIYVGGDVWEDTNYPNRYITTGMPLWIVLAVGALKRWRDDPPEPAIRALGVMLASFAAVLIWVGLEGEWKIIPPELLGAAAAALLLLGAGFRIRLAGRVPAGLRGVFLALAALLLFGLLNGRQYASWAKEKRIEKEFMTRVGLFIRRNTTSDAGIAVAWAGTIPYFSHRRSVDLLGKNDPVIARLRPKKVKGTLLPGHNKWDYSYSLGTFKPDLVVQLWSEGIEDIAVLMRLGYEKVGPCWVLGSSNRVNRKAFLELPDKRLTF